MSTDIAFDKYDDERILKNLVTDQEIGELETLLCRRFVEKAKKLEKKIIVHTDEETYQKLKKTEELFTGRDYHILRDPQTDHILDLVPIIYHQLDTPEGRFYAKILTQRGHLPP